MGFHVLWVGLPLSQPTVFVYNEQFVMFVYNEHFVMLVYNEHFVMFVDLRFIIDTVQHSEDTLGCFI